MKFKNHDKKGSYKLVSVAKQQVINPGDIIVIDQYISGYGQGYGVKIVYHPSADIFDCEKSEFSFGPKMHEDGRYGWGGSIGKPDAYGITACLGPFMEFKDSPSSYFLDADNNKNINQILSEINLRGSPPFQYKLKTRPNTKPGKYRLNFCLTYFNGDEWQTSEQACDFTVTNFFERHATIISFLAMLALITTIMHDGIYPLYEWLSSEPAQAVSKQACSEINTSILNCS